MTKNEMRENELVSNAISKLSDLRDNGYTKFQIRYTVRRRGSKTDIVSYNGFVKAWDGIEAEIELIGGLEKLKDIEVIGLGKDDMAKLQSGIETLQNQPTSRYKRLTLKDLIDSVKADGKTFPLGMDTPIFCGDDEGNYTHGQLGLQYMDVDGKRSLVISYDMHESIM
jgi:hypothetical protein